MTLQRRGNVWWTEFTIKGIRYRRSTSFADRVKAAEFETRIKNEIYDLRDLGRTQEMRYGEAIRRYIQETTMAKRRKPNGELRRPAYNDLNRLKRLEEYFGPQASLVEVSKPGVVGRLNEYLTRSMRPQSANRYLSVHRAVLNRAYDWGALKDRPAFRLNPEQKPRNRALTETQELLLLQVVPDRLRDLVMFVLDTGARREEALTLTWNDVDLNRRPRPVVHFRDAKNREHRSVPLPKRTIRLLKARMRRHGSQTPLVFAWKAQKNTFTNKGELFARKGDWTPLPSFQYEWQAVKEEMGIEDLRVHDLRHTYATKLINRGVPLIVVSRLLGHKTIKMTLRYAFETTEGFGEAVSALDGRRKSPRWSSDAELAAIIAGLNSLSSFRGPASSAPR